MGVDGYEAVRAPHTTQYWGGLEHNQDGYCLLDGSLNSHSWWYAVGVRDRDRDSYPGPGKNVYKVELYVLESTQTLTTKFDDAPTPALTPAPTPAPTPTAPCTAE